ncbi:MAG: lipopolysaccharide biosynthesis protein [Sphingomonadales bacterium]|nr:lipopolysaccharide biosynthesis protein [Sphingomonadales bacterium]
MSRQRVARNAVFAVAQVILSAAALLLTYWLMMRSLTVEEIGLWSLVVGSTLVARLSEMGLGAGVLRFVAGDMASGRPDRAAQTIGMAAVAVLILVSLLAVLVQPVLSNYLHRLTPARLHYAVDALLPAALAGVALGAVGNVFMAAIDGAQRMDVRAMIQVGGSLVQLAATWFILPRFGVSGLGQVQVAQSALLLVAGVVATLRLLRQPLRAYAGFDRTRFRELAFYGGGLQISAIAQLLFDPLLKVLLTTFSGLTLTGYYDMANRIVIQARSFIVAAYGALVPHIAARTADKAINPELVRGIYRESMTLLLFVLLPYFAVVGASLPLALVVWKGGYDPVFVQVALVQFVAWWLNLLSLPAYMLYVGMGKLRWTILSHAITAAIMVIAGEAGGAWCGGVGVLLAGAMALVLGSIAVMIAFMKEFGLRIADIATPAALRGFCLVLVAVAASAVVSRMPERSDWAVLLALPLGVGALALALIWKDPARILVRDQVRAIIRF